MTKLHEDIINLGELEGIVDEAYLGGLLVALKMVSWTWL